MNNFKLIIITPETHVKAEQAVIIGLFEQGLELLHIRKPSASKSEIQLYIDAIPAIYWPKIVLHSHFELSHVYPLKGIHLNEYHAKTKDENLGNYNLISRSIHALTDLTIHNCAPYEYVFLSPIFNSISKPGYHSRFTLEALTSFLNDFHQDQPATAKVIGLGGISLANFGQLGKIGFDGAALLGGLWFNTNPLHVFKQFQALSVKPLIPPSNEIQL